MVENMTKNRSFLLCTHQSSSRQVEMILTECLLTVVREKHA